MMLRLLNQFGVRSSHNFVSEFDQTIYGDSGYGGSGFIPQHSMLASKIKPATLAVLVQCVAFLMVMLSAWCVYFFTPYKLSGFSLALAQATVATALSYKLGAAVWWRWIHFIFSLAVWSMLQWKIPGDVYFYGFLVTLSLFWTTFRTQVPFYPSRSEVHAQVAELLPQNKPIRMMDIGSGLGDLVMHIAQHRQELQDFQSRLIGIEIAPLPWAISKARAYETINFAEFDVIFAYLSPAAMTALWQKAQREMRSGSMLMSYEFEITGVKPGFQISSKNGSPTLYVWKM